MGALPSFISTLSPSSRTPKQNALPPSLEEEASETVPSGTPYWQINVPEAQRTQECPGFLKDITERNRAMISVPSDQFHYQTWDEVKELIDTDTIDRFRRAPADHRKYLAYMDYIKNAYGSVMNFVQDKRLKWTDLTPKGAPFTNPDDMKIIYNDWPYGIDSRIVHLCVWTKFELTDNKTTERLEPVVWQEIDDHVEKTFRGRVPADRIRWFKNWANLKSIHSMEHFHVMLFDPDMDFIKEITKDDAPLSRSI